MALSPATTCFRGDHVLDDDLSFVLEDHGIIGRAWDGNRRLRSLLLRETTFPRLRMNNTSVIRSIAKIVLSLFASAASLYAQQNPEVIARAVPGPNDIARFLAGMPVPPDSPLAPLTRDPAWQEHSAFFEKEFTKLNLRQLQKLHAWEDTYLQEATQPIPIAFYMFKAGGRPGTLLYRSDGYLNRTAVAQAVKDAQ